MPPDTTRPLLTVAEAATLAGFKRATFYRVLPQLPPGTIVRLPGMRALVRRRLLMRWLEGDLSPAAAGDPNAGAQPPQVRAVQKGMAPAPQQR